MFERFIRVDRGEDFELSTLAVYSSVVHINRKEDVPSAQERLHEEIIVVGFLLRHEEHRLRRVRRRVPRLSSDEVGVAGGESKGGRSDRRHYAGTAIPAAGGNFVVVLSLVSRDHRPHIQRRSLHLLAHRAPHARALVIAPAKPKN